MKKLILCILALTLLSALPACEKQETPKEDMYFISQPTDASKEQCVMHYTGGSTLENIYPLPCDVFYIDGSQLYYALDKTIHIVDLTDSSSEEYADLPDDIIALAADSNGVYAMCRPLYGKHRYVIYKVTPEESTRVDENGVIPLHHPMTTGDGYLFYIGQNPDALMAYNTTDGKTTQIYDGAAGQLTYDSGFIYYTVLYRTARVNIETGEASFVQRGTSAPHNGFIYYAHQLFCEETAAHMYEIFRRKDNQIELCGKVQLPSMGFHELSDLISFGEYGFITQGINQFNTTEYTYFTYDGSENTVLTVE